MLMPRWLSYGLSPHTLAGWAECRLLRHARLPRWTDTLPLAATPKAFSPRCWFATLLIRRAAIEGLIDSN
jgi:hypothetical protein